MQLYSEYLGGDMIKIWKSTKLFGSKCAYLQSITGQQHIYIRSFAPHFAAQQGNTFHWLPNAKTKNNIANTDQLQDRVRLGQNL